MLERVLFVGEAPSKAGARALHPDDCASGRRLLEFTGWTRAEYLSTARVNLFPQPQKKWNALHAEDLTWAVPIPDYQFVVLLGRRVGAAFWWDQKADFLKWERDEDCAQISALCPHPSGRSRWWNDLDNRREARRFFNRLATEAWTR